MNKPKTIPERALALQFKLTRMRQQVVIEAALAARLNARKMSHNGHVDISESH